VSEEKGICTFIPRLPLRNDLDKNIGLVWAINEECLPNFLTPRDCPRVTYHAGNNTEKKDIQKYISLKNCAHVIAIENKWYDIMTKTTLYLYEFDTEAFYLQDEIAGYYVSEKEQKPIAVFKVNDLFAELLKRNIEVKVFDNLWDLCDQIKSSSFHWSMCRMGNALPKL